VGLLERTTPLYELGVEIGKVDLDSGRGHFGKGKVIQEAGTHQQTKTWDFNFFNFHKWLRYATLRRPALVTALRNTIVRHRVALKGVAPLFTVQTERGDFAHLGELVEPVTDGRATLDVRYKLIHRLERRNILIREEIGVTVHKLDEFTATHLGEHRKVNVEGRHSERLKGRKV